MEDRYSIIPSFFVMILTKIKLISRISDWGHEYATSLYYRRQILNHPVKFLDLIYKNFVLTHSSGAIVPSEYIGSLIEKEFNNMVLQFPYPLSTLSNKLCTQQCNIDFKDNNHDVYVALIGNFNYEPNEDAGNFLVLELAPKIKKVDKAIKFLLVGIGSSEKYSKYNCENVVSLGFVDDLDQIYTQCHIGINPSKTTGGTSIKNIEYLTKGLLVVSTPEASIGVLQNCNMFIENREEFYKLILKLSKGLRDGEKKVNVLEVERIKSYYSKIKIEEKTLIYLKQFY